MYAMKIPQRFMHMDASDGEKAVLEYYKDILTQLQNGLKPVIFMPSERDPESRHPLFEILYLPEGVL